MVLHSRSWNLSPYRSKLRSETYGRRSRPSLRDTAESVARPGQLVPDRGLTHLHTTTTRLCLASTPWTSAAWPRSRVRRFHVQPKNLRYAPHCSHVIASLSTQQLPVRSVWHPHGLLRSSPLAWLPEFPMKWPSSRVARDSHHALDDCPLHADHS